MRKFSLFVHKKYQRQDGSTRLRLANELAEQLQKAFLRSGSAPLPVLENPEFLTWEGDAKHQSDLEDAFEQASRVEAHIVPYNNQHHYPTHDVSIQVGFYRARERIYHFDAVLNPEGASIGTVFRHAEIGLFRKRDRIRRSDLVDPAIVHLDNEERLDIALGADQIIRVRYTSTMNDRPPKGGDYFYVERFKNGRTVSSVHIKASFCYQYLVDIGDGLVLYPSGDGIEKSIPFQPVMRRCTEWAVQEFDADSWRKDVPVMPLMGLKAD